MNFPSRTPFNLIAGSLALALVWLPSTISHGATPSPAPKQVLYFWQAPENILATTLGYSLGDSGFDSLRLNGGTFETTGKYSSSRVSLEVERGFWQFLTLGIHFNFQSTITTYETPVSAKEKVSGLGDPILVAKGRRWMEGGWYLHYGAFLTMPFKKPRWTVNNPGGQEFDAGNGGVSLEPYTGLSSPVGQDWIAGGKLSYQWNFEREYQLTINGSGSSGSGYNSLKFLGGNFLKFALFGEKQLAPWTYGAVATYLNQADYVVTTNYGTTSSNTIGKGLSGISAQGYASKNLAEHWDVGANLELTYWNQASAPDRPTEVLKDRHLQYDFKVWAQTIF